MNLILQRIFSLILFIKPLETMAELIRVLTDENHEKATFKFKLNNIIYKVEQTYWEDEDSRIWEVTLEIEPGKKVQMTPSNLPWSRENSMEIRTTGLEKVEVDPFVRVFLKLFEDFWMDGPRTRPLWILEVATLIESALEDWNDVNLPESWFCEE